MSSTKIEKIMNEAIRKIESLAIQLREYLNQMQSVDTKKKLKSMNNFAEELIKLIDAIIIFMSKFATRLND